MNLNITDTFQLNYQNLQKMIKYSLWFCAIYADIIRKKTKKSFKKRRLKGIKVFPKKRKTKNVNILVKVKKIFLKKKKARSENIVANV